MNIISRVRAFTTQNYEFVILAGIFLFTASTNIIWLILDNRPPGTSDETLYLLKIKTYVEEFNISSTTISQLSVGGRPILYQLLSIPIVAILGYSLDSGAFVNIFFQLILLIATYNIGKIARDKQTGILATILVAAYPPIVRLSRIFRPNFAVIACSAMTIWLLFKLIKTGSAKYAWLTNLSIAFGLHIHPTYLWGIPIPAALLQIYIALLGLQPTIVSNIRELSSRFVTNLRKPLFLHGILPSAILGLGVVLAWYLSYGVAIYDTLRDLTSTVGDTQSSKLILGTLSDNQQSYMSYVWYVITSPQAVSLILAVLFWVSLIMALSNRNIFVLLLVFFFIFSYAVHISQPTLSWRYFSQTLPIMAVLSAVWLMKIHYRTAKLILVLLCVGASAFNYATTTWGLNRFSQSADTIPGSIFQDSSNGLISIAYGLFQGQANCFPTYGFYCPDPPNKNKWPIDDMLKKITNDQDCILSACNLTIVTPNIFFYRGVPHYLDLEFPNSYITYNYVVNINALLKTQVNFQQIFESEYIIFNRYPETIMENLNVLPRDNILLYNLYNDFLNSPPLSFLNSHQTIAVFQVPDGSIATLIKRTKPLTTLEVEEVFNFFDPQHEYIIEKNKSLISVFVAEGDFENALSLIEELLNKTQSPEQRVSLLLEKANTYSDQAEISDAIKVFQQILVIEPDNFDAHDKLAKIFYARNECQNALLHYTARAKIKPTAKTYTDLGVVNRKCGSLEDAIEAYQNALDLDPKNPRTHFGLGLTYVTQKRWKDAQIELTKVIEYGPDTQYAQQAKELLEKIR